MTEPSSKAIDRLVEAVAASREIGERRIEALERSVDRAVTGMQQSADRIELQLSQAVAGIQQSADRIEQSSLRIEQSSLRVEQQVGAMSEHLTAIDIKIERLADQIVELTKAVNGHLKVAEKQADNISELTKLVAIQANTVATLISRTA